MAVGMTMRSMQTSYPVLLSSLAAAAALLVSGCADRPVAHTRPLPLGAVAGDQYLSDFYEWKQALPSHAGVLLKTEPMLAQPEITAAERQERVLYTSTDARWQSGVIPVSGTFYIPKGQAPAGGWPVVAWAHGTLGVADSCAPSWQTHRPRDAFYINRWLAEGFAVVATDYQGLGGPGPHPYLFWEAEGRSVLDSVRAVLSANPGVLRNQVVLTGQSQGSGSSLGASRIAPTYASDLNLVATIATGIAPHFVDGPVQEAGGRFTQGLPSRFMMLRLVGGALPDGGPSAEMLVSEKGRRLLEQARSSCIDEMRRLEQESGIDSSNAFTITMAELDSRLIASTSMTKARLPTPVFLGTGLADRTLTPRHQYAAAAALCQAGNALTWKTYAGITHNGIVNAAFDDELSFVRVILRGQTPRSNCTGLIEPSIPQRATPGIMYND